MPRHVLKGFLPLLAVVGLGLSGALGRECLAAGAQGPPAPVPPVYPKLKGLHLTTELVRAGRANVTVVVPESGVYAAQVKHLGEAVRKLTGAELPIETDQSPAAVVPIRGNLILLGNRSTNRLIGELYNRYYTLLDLRYPGPGGHVVRTLHNPFGDGKNVIFVGGSDPGGVDAAMNAFIEELKRAGRQGRQPNTSYRSSDVARSRWSLVSCQESKILHVGSAETAEGALSVGRIAKIKLGQGISVSKDVRELETWEASQGYGSVGYFGWNSISKRMAAYYMTGDEFHAREAIRLAFPDEQARREIAEIDGERIENKDEPLSGPYHYNAHMMILFWDLIEESPVFTDAERLRVTNAFSKQLDHRKNEGIYRLKAPSRAVGSRHGQWSAISLFCLGRYFQKDYPNPIWEHCIRSAQLHFRPLHEHAWVGGESDNLFWFNTGVAPIFTYLALTGDRKPIENGVVGKLLRAQEMLISGRQPDWALSSASIGFLHKAVYLTGDGRYLLYRQRTGVDTDIFRLGQSFWPEEHLVPKPPDDLAGRWSINPLPEPMWRARSSGLKQDESFQFGSYRSAADASGDFILVDGFNGASRNPYHTFAVLELRLNGYTLLKGYRNQVLTRADGLVEPQIAMDAALKHRDVLGGTVTVVGEVPNAAYCNWRRTLAQRVGRYALVADELTFRTDADNVEVQVLWETEHGSRTFADGHIEFTAPTETPQRAVRRGAQIRPARPMRTTRNGRVVTMEWVGPATNGERKVFFSLVGMQPNTDKPSLGCFQLDERAAALALPEPGLAVVEKHDGVEAELAVIATDHCYGREVKVVQFPGNGDDGKAPAIKLLSADAPVDVDWDFASGMLHVVTSRETSLQLTLQSPAAVKVDATILPGLRGTQTRPVAIKLSPGRHAIEGARPDRGCVRALSSWLSESLTAAQEKRVQAAAADVATAEPKLPPLMTAMTAQVGGAVVDLAVVPVENGVGIYAAEGKTIHLLSPAGKQLQSLPTDGPVRMLRWWPEQQLLLAGCADEKVIAFDKAGRRRWVFTSEMDPAVFRAAKTYWFKSAPGHEGIHGLYTGVFLDGKSQAFVGSACTLEIIDADGQLIRRMPIFWGKVSHFAIVDGPDGSLNLLASRKYNGTNTVAIIDNRTLNPSRRGFHGVPAGCTYVPGWSSMNRHHLFYEDLDGDGVREVTSEINGTWNRVTVWRADGRPLYDASFGPGNRIPSRNMRDLDVADLDGDGKKEIVTATSAGLVVALDHQCRKRWATPLNSPATVLACLPAVDAAGSNIVVGCEDGSVKVLDARGKLIHTGQVNGCPTRIETFKGPTDRLLVLLATEKGQLQAFALNQEGSSSQTVPTQ